MRRKVLFLCTHNSARSQMAEGLLRDLADDGFDVHSAGSLATEVRPEAAAVMAEIGIDLSEHQSKTLDRYLHEPFDLVITVCDRARDACPIFPHSGELRHWSIADPAAVPGSPGSDGCASSDVERLAAFRLARVDLERRIREEIVDPATGALDARLS